MKSWISCRRLAADILVLVLLGSSSTVFAAAGRTVGTYQVSPDGASTYTIPIWAPRGPNGLEPHMSLVYNSQRGNGYLGVGWTIAGISSIYRCNLTFAQDGDPAPIALTTSDGLCLDGQRLRLTSGTEGEAGSTYQTEVANFENVTGYSSAGNGPGYFVVQAANGSKYEYGNSATSQVLANGTALQWYLDKVTDAAGNTMTFSYDTATGTAVPDTISWTPTAYGATTYSYTMKFAYTTANAVPVYAYVAGTAVVNSNLLASITISYAGNTVKKYSLSYQQSPTTQYEELTQIQECADSAGSNCLSPTLITYQNGSAGTEISATSALSSTNSKVWNYDFGADGKDDLATCSTANPATVEVAMSNGAGYEPAIDTGISCYGVIFGDLLGNGLTGILANNGGTWYYYTFNGTSFTGISTGVAYDGRVAVLADVNGDGLPDLVEAAVTPNVGYTIYVRLNTSSGGTISFSPNNEIWSNTSYSYIQSVNLVSNTVGQFGNLRRLDFNGDGRDDLLLQTVTLTTFPSNPKGEQNDYTRYDYELISAPSSFSTTYIASTWRYNAPPTLPVAFLNFNSDACTDLLYLGDGSTTQNEIYISGCNGTVPQTINFGPVPVVGAMDWDGDGLTDILVNNGSTMGVYESTGNGLGNLISTGVPYSTSNTYFAFDLDGDGLDDLGVWSSVTPYPVSYFQHNGHGQLPDLMSSITDGYGNFVKPVYSPYDQVGAGDANNPAQYPYELYMGPLYVVTKTTFSDPTNPSSRSYSKTYTFRNGWMSLQGRGFAGFGHMEILDSRNSVYYERYYDGTFPYTGMLSSRSSWYNVPGFGGYSEQTISNVTYNLTNTQLSSVQDAERYFPYVSGSTDQRYDLNSGAIISTTTSSYSYDNYGNVTSAARTVLDQDGSSPYDGKSWTRTVENTPDVNADSWCLRLSSDVQISYTVSGSSSTVTRTRQYTPDTTSCRYNQITTEPGSNYQVVEALHYDDFGNVDIDTETGSGMAARTTQKNWGTTGQFPMSVTDATGATTQFDYDFGYGFLNSEVDPNGLTTSWEDGDGFGRLTREARPDRTFTTYAYVSCDSSDNYCGALDLRSSVQITNYGADASEINWRALYEDGIGESRYQEAQDLSGGYSYVVTYYDALGRVTTKSVPVNESTAEFDTTYSYDILNRLVKSQRPINENDGTLQTTSYAYQGDTTIITDPYGKTRTVIHDSNGWLRETKDALGYTITLGYDPAGARTSVTDSLSNGSSNPLWTGTYAYGIAPFLIGETDVDRGTWGYTVDALGERTAWTDPKGQQFQEQFDALSRPVTRTEPDLFTQWTWGSSAASHNIGKLASVCTGTGSLCSSSYYSESETYDSLGRVYQRAIAIPGMGSYTYTWQYNGTTGLIDTLTYPLSTSGQALQLKYGYQYGILQSITDVLDSPNVTIWQVDAQDPEGQNTQETFGNGIVTDHTYDSVTDWLSSVGSGPGGDSSAQNQSFLYDELGNLSQRQDNNLGLTENIYYDDDYRLSYSTLNGTQNLSLNYDQKGNITSRSDVASGATWTYDPVHVHEVTEAGSAAYQYGYDANGNVTSRQGSSITWSSYNYPTLINDTATGESVAFYYGPDRRAWMEQTQGPSGTEVAYHVGGLLDIVSSGGITDYRHYIYAGSEPVAIDSRKSSGANALYYLLSDHQGSVAAVTNSAGGVVVGESFTAYGGRRNPTTWSGAPSSSDLNTIAGITRHGYTFQDTLGSMGLNDMVGRVQDAITGRFLSADPTISYPTDPQSYNRYTYTRNNPLTYTDPSGFEDKSICAGDTGCSGGGDGGESDGGGFAPPPPTLTDLNYSFQASWSDGDSSESQQSDPFSQLQPVIIAASRLGASVSDSAIQSNTLLYLTAAAWNAALNKLGCTGSCRTLVAVATVVAAPEAAGAEEVTTGVEAATEEGIASGATLYRGVASDSPAFGDALNGVANPIGGDATMLEHSLGNTASNFTSWTSDYDVALRYATNSGTTSGVVLTNTFTQGLPIAASPNIEAIMGESEFLVPGRVSGANVTEVP